jgi:Serine-pyruvate aminotransferase/archaeal aspartate aminotransferase
MISFYPGPSRVHDKVPAYVKDAYKEGIMSINHRSDDFIRISKRTVTLLKQKLGIPSGYMIFFTSSATECWEIIAQSLITGKSLHHFNGAFGQKWFEYTRRLHPEGATPFPFDVNEALNLEGVRPDTPEDVICLTQNETSNGTQVGNGIIKKLRKALPENVIAVDATSSMAGIKLDFKSADVWYASVQKCFGLPAGLGVMVCSPMALARAKAIGEKDHYNSLTFLINMMEKWQTSYTPNVLAIYLLMRSLEDSDPIATVEEKTIRRYAEWTSFLKSRKSIAHFVENESVRSFTVVPVKGDEKTLTTIKKKARKEGLLLGEGYGEFKPLTFRIANFPAIKEKEIRLLKTFLTAY